MKRVGDTARSGSSGYRLYRGYGRYRGRGVYTGDTGNNTGVEEWIEAIQTIIQG